MPERFGLLSGPESFAKKRCTCSGSSTLNAWPTIPSFSSVHTTTGVPTGSPTPSPAWKQNTRPPLRFFFPSVTLYVVADGQSDSFVDAPS